MNTSSLNQPRGVAGDVRPSSQRGRAGASTDIEPIHIPINRKRLVYTLGGALLALVTLIGLVIGMVRANDGVPAADGVEQGPNLKAGEVQRVPNLPTD